MQGRPEVIMDRAKNIEKPRVAVVGGGLAGLVAAYQLVKGGAEVVLFEKSVALGGRAGTVVKDGFHLNQGPHALYIGGVAYKFLTDIGARPQGALPAPVRALALTGGQLFDLPVDIKTLLRTKMFGLGEKLELALFFARLPKMATSDLMAVRLKSWLGAAFSSPRVRLLVEAFARLSTYAHNSDAMSAGAALRQLNLANQGPLYLHEGWASIIHSLQSALGTSVEYRFNAQIEAVRHIEDGGVEIVDVQRNLENFDAAILCLPPQAVNALVPGVIEKNIHEDIKSSHAACLDICLKRLPV